MNLPTYTTQASAGAVATGIHTCLRRPHVEGSGVPARPQPSQTLSNPLPSCHQNPGTPSQHLLPARQGMLSHCSTPDHLGCCPNADTSLRAVPWTPVPCTMPGGSPACPQRGRLPVGACPPSSPAPETTPR